MGRTLSITRCCCLKKYVCGIFCIHHLFRSPLCHPVTVEPLRNRPTSPALNYRRLQAVHRRVVRPDEVCRSRGSSAALRRSVACSDCSLMRNVRYGGEIVPFVTINLYKQKTLIQLFLPRDGFTVDESSDGPTYHLKAYIRSFHAMCIKMRVVNAKKSTCGQL